jgi:hypothetical protein
LSRKPAQSIKPFGGEQFHVTVRRAFTATIAATLSILIRHRFQPNERRMNGSPGPPRRF